MPDDFTITRTGQPPLTFTSKLVAEAKRDPEKYRWYELRIYESAGGKFVVEIVYQSTFVHHIGMVGFDKVAEPEFRFAQILDRPEDVSKALTDYRKLATIFVKAFSAGERFDAPRERVNRAIQGEYDPIQTSRADRSQRATRASRKSKFPARLDGRRVRLHPRRSRPPRRLHELVSAILTRSLWTLQTQAAQRAAVLQPSPTAPQVP